MKSILVICIICFLVACGGSDQPPSNNPGSYHALTPKGITVRSDAPIPADVLSICDQQIDDLFVRAEANGIRDYPRHRGVSIKIVPRSPACISPAFLVYSNCSPGPFCYDGTVYDMDPKPGQVAICAAGQFVETTDQILVTVDGLRESPVVRYEGEHWLLFHSNYPWYLRTKVHTADNSHPILGD